MMKPSLEDEYAELISDVEHQVKWDRIKAAVVILLYVLACAIVIYAMVYGVDQ
jgi:hypothetical protein